MIKEKDLQQEVIDALPVGPRGDELTYSELEQRIRTLAHQEGLSLDVRNDEIKLGGLIGSTLIPCMVLAHTEHTRDYYQICVILSKGELSAYFMGSSKQHGLIDKQAKAKENRGKRADFETRRFRGLGAFGAVQAKVNSAVINAGSMAMSGVRALQRDSNALDAEDDFYARCISVVKTAAWQ